MMGDTPVGATRGGARGDDSGVNNDARNAAVEESEGIRHDQLLGNAAMEKGEINFCIFVRSIDKIGSNVWFPDAADAWAHGHQLSADATAHSPQECWIDMILTTYFIHLQKLRGLTP